MLDGDVDVADASCIPVLKDALVGEGHLPSSAQSLIVFKEFLCLPSRGAAGSPCQAGGFAQVFRACRWPAAGISTPASFDDEYPSEQARFRHRQGRTCARKFKAIDAEHESRSEPDRLDQHRSRRSSELYPLYLQIAEKSSSALPRSLRPSFSCSSAARCPSKVRSISRGRQERPSGRLQQPAAMHDRRRHHLRRIRSASTINRASAPASTTTRSATHRELGARQWPEGLCEHRPFLTTRNCTSAGTRATLDLYVRHRSAIGDFVMKSSFDGLDPTRHDKTLAELSNYADL